VGTSSFSDSTGFHQFAFINNNGTFHDLNTLIPANSGIMLLERNGINDNGQISCNGLQTSGAQQQRGVLLTPK
jgi:hypothetical protein